MTDSRVEARKVKTSQYILCARKVRKCSKNESCAFIGQRRHLAGAFQIWDNLSIKVNSDSNKYNPGHVNEWMNK